MFERRPQHSGKRRPQLLELDRKWAIKFGLRFVAFVLVIVGVISFGVVASYYKGSGDGYSGFTIDTVLPFILLGIAFLYNSLHFLLLYLQHRPLHPGLVVAIDLILCLFFITTAILTILSGNLWWCNTNRGGGFPSCSKPAASQIHYRAVWKMIGSVTLGVCFLLHFALFVIACRDTNLRRRCRKYFSQSHGDKTTDSTTRLANTRTPSLTSASKLTGMYTSDDRKGELPPCDELESGQIMHSVEPTTQWTYPGKLENKNTVWQPEIEDRNLICPPLVTDLGGLSEDNSPVVGHPAMGSVDKEYEARMQMERDAANHPALRHLNAREKEMRG